jgi:hypothetical protein
MLHITEFSRPRALLSQACRCSRARLRFPTPLCHRAGRRTTSAESTECPRAPPNVYEAAALQERARADHQRVLGLIVREVQAKGGTCLYNNNVDLLSKLGDERLLVEAKSLNDLLDAVDRMRYGMGQLLDYGVRYRSELQGAKPMLAFGRPPASDAQWIGDILQENGVAFAAATGDALIPLNERARLTRLFAG